MGVTSKDNTSGLAAVSIGVDKSLGGVAVGVGVPVLAGITGLSVLVGSGTPVGIDVDNGMGEVDSSTGVIVDSGVCVPGVAIWVAILDVGVLVLPQATNSRLNDTSSTTKPFISRFLWF